MSGRSGRDIDMVVVRTTEQSDLRLVALSHVQAVVFLPPQVPKWLDELGDAVAARRFVVPRTQLDDVGADDVEAALGGVVRVGVGPESLHRAVIDDVVSLAECVRALTEATSFTIRIFTEEPTARCGFHVDTVPPGAPAIGALRVYNGVGTSYVEPRHVTSMRDFYRYLGRRERLVRDMSRADDAGDLPTASAARVEVERLDAELPFVAPGGATMLAPARSVVLFKHLDASLHWSANGPSRSWIHCSPVEGGPRLVVNVSPASHRASRRVARA